MALKNELLLSVSTECNRYKQYESKNKNKTKKQKKNQKNVLHLWNNHLLYLLAEILNSHIDSLCSALFCFVFPLQATLLAYTDF